MENVIFYVLTVFFTGFGMLSFFMYIIDFFYETKYLKNKTVYTFFVAKNEVGTIENVTRGIIFKIKKANSGICDHKIFVVDDDSTDGTYGILKHISKAEKTISVVKSNEEIKKLINNV